MPLIWLRLNRSQVQEERNALPPPGSGVAFGKVTWRPHFPDCLDEQAAGPQRPGIRRQRPVLAGESEADAAAVAHHPKWAVCMYEPEITKGAPASRPWKDAAVEMGCGIAAHSRPDRPSTRAISATACGMSSMSCKHMYAT